MHKTVDIAIIGAGPAGLAAAVYAGRAGKSVLIFEKESFGGQMNYALNIENYPGILSVSGSELASRMTEQALAVGADTEFGRVVSVEKKNGLFYIRTEDDEFTALSVIASAGVMPGKLGLPYEEELTGYGVSYCAICDGAFYSKKTVIVAGGGNAAADDALVLSDICEKVYIVHRRGEFRAEKSLVDELLKKSNVETVLDVKITELLRKNISGSSSEYFAGIKVRGNSDGIEREIAADGLFVAVGRIPDNSPFISLADMDEKGYIMSNENGTTSVDGFFTAGDCRAKSIRQITTAVSDGASAALSACEYLRTAKIPGGADL